MRDRDNLRMALLPQAVNNTLKVIKLAQVKELTSLSPATIYRLIEKGKFPRQLKLAERCSGWLLEDIYNWINEKKDARDRGES